MDIRQRGVYKGVKYEIYYDRDSVSPRHDCDNVTMMACWHRRLKLGDNITETFEEVEKIIKSSECLTFKKLYMYNHGGIVLATNSLGCHFDSGQVGYIYITKEMLDNAGITKRDAKSLDEIIDSEIEIYNSYLQGEVYGYNTKFDDGDEELSCWGYIGSDLEKNGILPDIRETIDNIVVAPQIVKYFDMSENDVELCDKPKIIDAYLICDSKNGELATTSENSTGVSQKLENARSLAEYYEECGNRPTAIYKCKIVEGKVTIYTDIDYRYKFLSAVEQ